MGSLKPVVVALLLLVVPSSAQGATLAVDGPVLRFTAAAGEINDVTMRVVSRDYSSTTVEVSDPGAGLMVGHYISGCTGVSAVAPIRCSGAIKRVEIDLGDGDDRAQAPDLYTTFFGGEGEDELLGGKAGGLYVGGPERDLIVGGTGSSDGLSYRDHEVPVTVDLGAMTSSEDEISGIELAEGGSGDDTLRAHPTRPAGLYGLAGDDRLVGLDGNDLLYGGTGADDLDCGAGDDITDKDTGDARRIACERVYQPPTGGGGY